jgi:uncharacterized protein (DUF58 family)
MLWTLVYPKKGDRLMLSIPGFIVLAVALGFGVAAYNTSNNILFIALSLLLACLVFSGILSWLNLLHLSWRLSVQAPLRALTAESNGAGVLRCRRCLCMHSRMTWRQVKRELLMRAGRP